MTDTDGFSVVVYNVSTTFPIVSAEAAPADLLPLVAAITGAIEPMTWEAMGGGGSLRVFQRQPNIKSWLLVIRQSSNVHDLIKDTLNQLKAN
jgi:hypothetical protein